MIGSPLNSRLVRNKQKQILVKFGAALTLAIAGIGITQADERSEKSQELLKQVRKARVIDLSHTWEIQSPIASVNLIQ